MFGIFKRIVREGVRAEAAPVGRQLAEVRGLANQTIRRLDRIEGKYVEERHARVDDLAVLVELMSASWKGVEERLSRIEESLASAAAPHLHSVEQRRAAS